MTSVGCELALRSTGDLDGVLFAGLDGQALDEAAPLHFRGTPGAVADLGVPSERPRRGLLILPGSEFRRQCSCLGTRRLAEVGVLGQVRQLTGLAKFRQLSLGCRQRIARVGDGPRDSRHGFFPQPALAHRLGQVAPRSPPAALFAVDPHVLVGGLAGKPQVPLKPCQTGTVQGWEVVVVSLGIQVHVQVEAESRLHLLAVLGAVLRRHQTGRWHRARNASRGLPADRFRPSPW